MLDELIGSIRRTAELVQEVSATSNEQASGVAQINKAMAQVDRVTQRNAASAEELSATAEELSSQAQALRTLVEFFNSGPSPQPGGSAPARPHEVTLAPFFLAKYEMTQGQWLALAGRNPSQYNPAAYPLEHTLLDPLENVSYDECALILPRYGLELPTEAQWEYASRAGTTTTWWTGDDVRSLEHSANIADQTFAVSGASLIEDWLELEAIGRCAKQIASRLPTLKSGADRLALALAFARRTLALHGRPDWVKVTGTN